MTLCACGCGQETAIAKKTSTAQGCVRGRPNRYVHGHHIGRGDKSITWKGGRTTKSCLYPRVYLPDHPRASSNGYVLEHLLIAERALGKALPTKAEVHHFDGDRQNNANDNLVVCQDGAYHALLHQRQRAMEACGNPSALRCKYCKGYDRQDDIAAARKKGQSSYHRSCLADYRRSHR